MHLVFKGGGACPEQYEVFDEDSDTPEKQVAYVRLRWGRLRVEAPDCGGEEIYSYAWLDEGYKGMFDSDEEKAFHMKEIRKAIYKYYKAP